MSKQTTLDLTVVGMSHRVSISTRRMMAASVEEDFTECILQREPLNPHDKNAIKVVISTGPYNMFHIGYIDKTVAAELAPALDSGKAVIQSVVLVNIDAQQSSATIEVTLKTSVQAKSAPVKKKSRRNP